MCKSITREIIINKLDPVLLIFLSKIDCKQKVYSFLLFRVQETFFLVKILPVPGFSHIRTSCSLRV